MEATAHLLLTRNGITEACYHGSFSRKQTLSPIVASGSLATLPTCSQSATPTYATNVCKKAIDGT